MSARNEREYSYAPLIFSAIRFITQPLTPLLTSDHMFLAPPIDVLHPPETRVVGLRLVISPDLL